MKIENLKEFQKVIQACRKLGVQSAKIDNVEFHLGDLPQPRQKFLESSDPLSEAKITVTQPNDTQVLPVGSYNVKAIAEKIASDGLSEEQLLFYSSRSEAFSESDPA